MPSVLAADAVDAHLTLVSARADSRDGGAVLIGGVVAARSGHEVPVSGADAPGLRAGVLARGKSGGLAALGSRPGRARLDRQRPAS